MNKTEKKYLESLGYRRFLPYLTFLFLSILIVFPLLKSGFVLSLDMVFTPSMIPEPNLTLFNIHQYFLRIFAIIFGGELTQKIILLLIFTAIPSLFYFSTKKLFDRSSATFVGAIFYLFNPFVYERFLAGHWLFLLGYALMPLFFYLVHKYYAEESSNRNLFNIILIWLLATLFSKHHFLLFGIIFISFFIFNWIREVKTFRTLKILTRKSFDGFIVTLTFIAILYFSSKDLPFSSSELLVFASSAKSDLGLIGNLLTFNGFWTEAITFRHIFENNILGKIITLIIVASVLFYFLVFGFKRILNFIDRHTKDKTIDKVNKFLNIEKFNNTPNIFWQLLFIAFIGFIFSLGSNGFIGEVYTLLFEDFPILKGMREPQKFLNLYVFASAIVIVVFILFANNILGRISKSKIISIVITIIFSLLIFVSSYPIIAGANGQLISTTYPKIYSEMEKIISTEQPARMLYLPTHPYIDTNWNNRRFANPSKSYFNTEVLSYSLDFSKAFPECDIYFELIEAGTKMKSCFYFRDDISVFVKTLKVLNVKFIMLENASNFDSYNEFLTTEELEILYEKEDGIIYRVK